MRVAVRKWGNSLALRIPKSLAEDSRLGSGSEVELTVEDGRLVVTTVPPAVRLDELLAAVTDENRHSEVPTGQPVGREAW
ncbi:MAG: AbrB/MazE/SpoVT family DNA-binding domain-containing protein [Gemmatimonadaceae bacterium]